MADGFTQEIGKGLHAVELVLVGRLPAGSQLR